MKRNTAKLTILFEYPFWIGILERTDCKGFAAAKKIFGIEPSDIEIYQFLLQNQNNLKFSPPLKEKSKPVKHKNPKRLQREAQKEMKNTRLTSKAHDALKIAIQQNKKTKNENRKLRKKKEIEQKFLIKQRKKKFKKRGH